MLIYQAKLQNKHAFLFRLVHIANELFAQAASASRARTLVEHKAPDAAAALDLADAFCRDSRRRVRRLFRELWSNEDNGRHRVALDVLDGRHTWIQALILRLPDH